jgi:hypothetical protein
MARVIPAYPSHRHTALRRSADGERAGVAWQCGLWDRSLAIDQRKVDQRFVPVLEEVLRRATLVPSQHVLDLGTGTGVVIIAAPHPEPLIDRCLVTLCTWPESTQRTALDSPRLHGGSPCEVQLPLRLAVHRSTDRGLATTRAARIPRVAQRWLPGRTCTEFP